MNEGKFETPLVTQLVKTQKFRVINLAFSARIGGLICTKDVFRVYFDVISPWLNLSVFLERTPLVNMNLREVSSQASPKRLVWVVIRSQDVTGVSSGRRRRLKRWLSPLLLQSFVTNLSIRWREMFG